MTVKGDADLEYLFLIHPLPRRLVIPRARSLARPSPGTQLIFILVSSYPLAHIFTRLPLTAPHLKHLFSIVLTSFYLVGMFKMKWGYIQLVADAVAVWGIVVGKVGVRPDGRGEGWMPWLVFV